MMAGLSFPDAVAEKCGHPVGEVTSVLASARVPTTDVGGAPHRLRVTRLAFTGRKAGLLTDDINFDQEFVDGLWAISSERNDAGKTSILEIIMWCLRGEPKRLQDDVQAWLHTVTLEGLVDESPFVVTFDNTGAMPEGFLTCGSDVRPFASDAAFADTMSQFMMERLGFDSFELWVTGQGLATHHWPSYSTVLYLPREAEGAVIGDRAGDGVAQQLVQLFVGIPWARTYSACRAARRGAEEQSTAQGAERQTFSRVASGTLAAKRAELAAVQSRLLSMPSDMPSHGDITAAKTKWMSLITQHSRATADLQEAQTSASSARRRAQSERKRLRDVTEAALARRLFQGLNPSKCPRCSVDIGPERREAEKSNHACAVCDRELDLHSDVEIDDVPITAADADDAQSGDDLQQLVQELEEVAQLEDDRASALVGDVEGLARQVDEAEVAVEDYNEQAAQAQERRTLELEAASLEAVVAELSRLSGDDDPNSPEQPDSARLEILQAAMEEAKARRDREFDEIVDEINHAILDLARRFGFSSLEKAKLNLAAQLRLVKGGAHTSFSYQTPGEKLRLRIAVVVACRPPRLLRMATSRWVRTGSGAGRGAPPPWRGRWG
jgi:RNA polymerase-binding transcription factor DksA